MDDGPSSQNVVDLIVAEPDLRSLQAVHEAVQRGNFEHAGSLADAALLNGMEHPLLFNVAALKQERQGNDNEAERLLQRALQIAPNDIGSRNALGLCLLRLERPSEALRHFDELLRLNAALPYAHVSRGNALLALGESSEAETSYRRALSIDVNQSLACAGLARIASGRGAHAETRIWAEKALRLVPGFPDAVMSLASAELGENQVQAAEARIQKLLGDERLAPLERAYALGLLGDIFDAQNRTEEAFSEYQACNTKLQHIYVDRFKDQSALEYVRAMNGFFERMPQESWQNLTAATQGPVAAKAHVFLLGFPRSGTTLLEVILGGHPSVAGLEEKELLIASVQAFMKRPQDLDRLLHASPAAIEVLRADYWRRVAAEGLDVRGKIFLDTYPLNTLKLPLIARLFPGAKILFACRDPRDIVLSCFRHRFRMSAPLYELLSIDGAARYYDAVMQLLTRLTASLTLDVCLVRHEDLVTEFAREIKRVCGFLALDWHPAMANFAVRIKDRAMLTPGATELVNALRTEGVGHWRRYGDQMATVLPLLDQWVKRFYYDAV